ncbi:MAG: hypothetical protein SF053_17170 [Bacteroidia bacterium]|nr:hypothetical protein [Bacteroidia bacterium]
MPNTERLSIFYASLDAPGPPAGSPVPVMALWWDYRGDWDQAHDLINDLPGPDAAWVHAYLHRKEGDPGNAAWWYRQAGRPVCRTSLREEWEHLVAALAG